MYSEIDLNIDNYDLKDIINLFGISYSISENELKNAKKIVLQTHPDKSNLDKKYFLFFNQAYKIIYNIYLFRNKGNINKKDREIDTLKDADKKIIDKYLNNKEIKKDFNKWFNTLFEKTQLKDDFSLSGYGDWLKSQEDIEDFNNINKDEAELKIEEKKKSLQQIITYNNDIENSYLENNILLDKPDSYSSEIFSKLNFEDVKKAHLQSVIPITKDDINNLKHISLEEMKNLRGQKILPSSLEQAEKYLKNKEESENIFNTNRAYKLLIQDEKHKKQNDIWWSNLKQIK